MPSAIHSSALVESADVGEGTRVWAFAHVMEGAKIGKKCNIGDHAFIESGAVIGDRVTIKNSVLVWNGVTVEEDAFIGPGVVFTNDKNPRAAFMETPRKTLKTRVERGATVGANATIVCGITLRAYSFVGAGSVVTEDVPSHALVLGVPARIHGWVCECGRRLPENLRCRCEREYVRCNTGLERA